MSELLSQGKNPSLPSVKEVVDEVPGLKKGSRVCLQKINPLTNQVIPSTVDLKGELSCYGNHAPKICRGQPVYVLTPELKRLKRRTSDFVRPNCTSPVKYINLMTDGSYWVHTVSGSIYRYQVLPQQEHEVFRPNPPSLRDRIRKLFSKETER